MKYNERVFKLDSLSLGSVLNSECEGQQLVTLLEKIRVDIAVWFAADVNSKPMFPSQFSSQTPERLGSTSRLISMSGEVDQYFSGVFLGLINDISDAKLLEQNYNTEDKYSDMEINFDIEIRALDTSYFEVYLKNSAWLKGLGSNL